MNLLFSWNAANVRHIAKHGVTVSEAEYVIRNAGRGFPRKMGDGKWIVKGQTDVGRRLQVIFIFPEDDELDVDSLSVADLIAYSDGSGKVVYVIHSMPISSGRIR
ncbi:MAG TPA: hypothetical protein VH370_17070 [Humisphaera sp.]|nr:hypothetical protein [Humisphaera sp.]